MNKVLIGQIGVDSGQVMIGDPCYINSMWNPEEEFQDIRIYRHKDDPNKTLQFGVDFRNYGEMINGHNGQNMNQLLSDGLYIKVPNEDNDNFSYNGACTTTIKHNFGVLSKGLSIVSNSGYGDGSYDVFAYVENDCVHKLEIVFIDEEEEEA